MGCEKKREDLSLSLSALQVFFFFFCFFFFLGGGGGFACDSPANKHYFNFSRGSRCAVNPKQIVQTEFCRLEDVLRTGSAGREMRVGWAQVHYLICVTFR